MSDVLDLTTMATPEPRQIRVGDPAQTITVNPPKTSSVLRLGVLSQKLQDVNNLSAEDIEKVVTDLRGEVDTCVPELTGIELNLQQLTAVLEILVDMGMPGSDAEASGVEVDSSKKGG